MRYNTLEQLDRAVESRMDSLDRLFLNSPMSQAVYDRKVKALNRWANAREREIPKGRQ
jgi:hypothetical protein